MSKCIIIAPLYQGEERAWLQQEAGDVILCADGGYAAARRFGIRPDLVVGDFDSMPEGEEVEGDALRLPVRKDDTDMVVCLREGRKRGCRSFRIAGALGGRMDHTLANMQCLYDCALRGEEAWLCSPQDRVTILLPGRYALPALPGRKLSLLAWDGEVTGVTLRGTLWELTDHTLSPRHPLGVSNEATAETVSLSFATGALVVCWSMDAGRADT